MIYWLTTILIVFTACYKWFVFIDARRSFFYINNNNINVLYFLHSILVKKILIPILPIVKYYYDGIFPTYTDYSQQAPPSTSTDYPQQAQTTLNNFNKHYSLVLQYILGVKNEQFFKWYPLLITVEIRNIRLQSTFKKYTCFSLRSII